VQLVVPCCTRTPLSHPLLPSPTRSTAFDHFPPPPPLFRPLSHLKRNAHNPPSHRRATSTRTSRQSSPSSANEDPRSDRRLGRRLFAQREGEDDHSDRRRGERRLGDQGASSSFFLPPLAKLTFSFPLFSPVSFLRRDDRRTEVLEEPTPSGNTSRSSSTSLWRTRRCEGGIGRVLTCSSWFSPSKGRRLTLLDRLGDTHRCGKLKRTRHIMRWRR
jgi:hypothetical protein